MTVDHKAKADLLCRIGLLRHHDCTTEAIVDSVIEWFSLLPPEGRVTGHANCPHANLGEPSMCGWPACGCVLPDKPEGTQSSRMDTGQKTGPDGDRPALGTSSASPNGQDRVGPSTPGEADEHHELRSLLEADMPPHEQADAILSLGYRRPDTGQGMDAPQGRGAEWLPIESAPKDGTSVLAIWSYITDKYDYGAKTHAIVHFSEHHQKWWSNGADKEPTHWMPLPFPPTQPSGPGQVNTASPSIPSAPNSEAGEATRDDLARVLLGKGVSYDKDSSRHDADALRSKFTILNKKG